jgi:hypothetical protein
MGNANVSEPLEQGFSRGKVKSFPEIYKAAVDFRRTMSCLLDDGPEGKDVDNGLMSGSEIYLSSNSVGSTLKLVRELHMENRSIELRECVTHHDRLVVIGI